MERMQGMERIFPATLIACVASGRAPQPEEICEVAARIRDEAFGRLPQAGWAHGAQDSIASRRSLSLAKAAFGLRRGHD
jgi:hypothetical protein